MRNIHLDGAIFNLQSQGGISVMWRALTPRLKALLPDCTFDLSAPPDVFISSYYQPAPKGVPSIAVCYDFCHEQYAPLGEHHPDAILKRAAIHNAAAVIAISQDVADTCQVLTGYEATVAYLATDYQRVSLDSVQAFERKYQLDKPYLLLVGKRGLYKNARALYQAWRWGKDLTVLAVGGEDCTPDDQTFAKHGDWRRVVLEDAELCAAYSGALALVYPSFCEGFGLPVLEALACGCPVIASGIPCIKEIAGEALIQVDPFRPLSIVNAVNVASQPDLRLQYILRGYNAAKRFSWQSTAKVFAEVIKSL